MLERSIVLLLPYVHIVLFHWLFRTFEWLDDKKGSKKLSKIPAKQFIDVSLTQIQKQLEDEAIFPTKFGELILLPLCVLYLVAQLYH